MRHSTDRSQVASLAGSLWLFAALYLALAAAGCTESDNVERRSKPKRSASIDATDGDTCKNKLHIRNGEEVATNAALAARYRGVGRLRVAISTTQFSSCTGTLIRRDVVLTARHCVAFDANQTAVEPASKVAFEFSGSADRINAKLVHVMPGSYRDAAIVVLERAYPISVPIYAYDTGATSGLAINDVTELVGYGLYVSSGTPGVAGTAGIKRAGVGKYQGDADQNFGGAVAKYHWVAPTATNQSVCNGDSGGPLFKTMGGKLTIMGIASTVVLIRANMTPDQVCREGVDTNFTRLIDVNTWIGTTLANSPAAPATDDVPPMVANGALSLTADPSSVSSTWTLASDVGTDQGDLEYRPYYVASNNTALFASVNGIETAGTPAQPYTRNVGAAVISGLKPETTYVVAVIVRDKGGNKVAYTAAKVTTTRFPDSTPPIVGSGRIREQATDSLALAWSASQDDRSPAAMLSYRVFRADDDTIGSVGAAEIDGTLVGQGVGITDMTASGLTSGKTYWFTVVVQDAEGNKAAYPSFSGSTTTVEKDPGESTAGGPSLPTRVVISTPSTNAVTVTWDGAAPGSRHEIRVVSVAGQVVTSARSDAEDGSVTLGDLVAESEYFVVFRSEDDAGRISTSTQIPFRTPDSSDTPTGGSSDADKSDKSEDVTSADDSGC